MPQVVEVSDPSDWLGGELESLRGVDAALRCQVCKEFFKTPMITSCSHSFCSLCIRRCLNEEGKCPTCRAEDSLSRLRKNAILDELVEAFQKARPSVLHFGQVPSQAQQNRKRKLSSETSLTEGETRRLTRSRSCRSDPEDDAYMPSPIKGSAEEQPHKPAYVRCPICGERMKEELVFSHLDIHSGNRGEPEKMSRNHLQEHKAEETQLPSINYSILNESQLRKRLSALGIPSNGSKPIMQRRHTEFVNLWNANCDSSAPRPKQKLLQDLASWERNQTSQASSSVMKKDFDGKAWSTEHENSFKDLVARARRGKLSTTSQLRPGKDSTTILPEQEDTKDEIS